MNAVKSELANLQAAVDLMVLDVVFAAQVIEEGAVRLNGMIARDGDLPIFIGDEVELAPIFDGMTLAEMNSPVAIEKVRIIR